MTHHRHYAHYSARLIDRLDGPYGHVESRLNDRIASYAIGPDVLDLGCGFGSLVAHLGTLGFQAVGIDLLDFQIEAGKKRFPTADLRVIEEGRLPFPSGSFDTVVLKDTLHHLAAETDLKATLGEIARVCRRRLIVLEPNPTWLLRLGRRLIGHVDPTFAPDQARTALDAAGFVISQVSFIEAFLLPLSGGYIGRRLVPRWLVPPLTALDDALVRVFGRAVAWRYLLVADVMPSAALDSTS